MGTTAEIAPLHDRPAALWAASFAWWTLNGLTGAANYRQMTLDEGTPATWEHALRTAMASVYLWVPLTVAIFWLARRHPIERGRAGRAVLVHVAAGLGVVLLRAALIYAGNRWIGWYRELPSFGSVLVTSFDNNLFLYWMFVGVAHALHYARRSRERELAESRLLAQLAEARLGALKSQLQPHFLFNTLNSLSELIHRDKDAADRMIVRLSELLRRTLDTAADQEVTLREELDFIKPYLEIEQIRFGDRLSAHFEIEPDALDARVPHLILQPLVENALRHGLWPRLAPGSLTVAARRRADRLALEVRDDGVGVAAAGRAGQRGGGVGLANTRMRLSQRYGDDHRFSLLPSPGGGAVAAIDIPFERAGGVMAA